MAHEVRNFCGAISLRMRNLSDRYSLSEDQDFQGLITSWEDSKRLRLSNCSLSLRRNSNT